MNGAISAELTTNMFQPSSRRGGRSPIARR
jgi:hypothetical protein